MRYWSNRSRTLAPLFTVLIVLLDKPALAQQEERQSPDTYHSPYRLEYKISTDELIGDLQRTERGDPRLEAEIPFDQWYSRRTLERWGAWGPAPRHYPENPEINAWPTARKRERALAVAAHYIGHGYQHHHIPDWSPPAGWPWKETGVGHNGPGVDCSNFTGFVYNQGFGLKLNTDVARQAEERFAQGQGGRRHPIRRMELPESYDQRIEALRTGDLLYILGKPGGHVTHVVFWVGPIGQSPDGTPLVLDSHGEGVEDCNGVRVPCGVHLRPFREDSWYNRCASHAHRLFVGD